MKGFESSKATSEVVVSFFIAEDITQRKFGDHGDFVIFKIMVKFPGCD
jgi:hypothetical protein